MRKVKIVFRKSKPTIATIIMMMVLIFKGWAQAPAPVVFQNNSQYLDSELFIAILGEDLSGPPGRRVWVNLTNGAQMPMDPIYNTVTGPIYNGNRGPGGNAKYASCFTKLSDIPNKKVMLSGIQGARAFIAIKQQLYFYFFGVNAGYSAPNPADPNDPNTGIAYELIELTYNSSAGFFGNTTRVDGYQIPMAIEVTGTNGLQKTGEMINHATIGAMFQANVPTEFQACYHPSDGSITAPSKASQFQSGGPYANYFQPYIDAIWSKYVNEDLIFDASNMGIFKGRVVGNQLRFTAQSGPWAGQVGVINNRPSTLDALGGAGVLAQPLSNPPVDLFVQNQVCAALNRHMINTTTPNPGTQNWCDASKFYQTSPCNHYAKFWHMAGVSYNQLSYGFAYDDVCNQSSTLFGQSPSNILIIFGGYGGVGGTVNLPPQISITAPANNTVFSAPASVTITANATDDGTIAKVEFFNGTTLLGTSTTSPYTYNWTNVAAGSYTITAKATDDKGASTTSSPITINVQGPYSGTPANIPGTIEAENYDLGGQDIAYNDVTPTNQGGAYRSDAVDIETISTGGFDVGYFDANEWMEYTVNVAAGMYKVDALVASNVAGTSFRVEMDGSTIATFNVPNTGGWQTWQTISVSNVNLTAGKKIMRIFSITGNLNLDKVIFTGSLPPVVSITTPLNNATYVAPASVSFTASATSTSSTISKVEYYNGATLIGSSTTAPYSYNWTGVLAGTYTITAKAYDNAGLTATSVPITVKVNSNQNPTVTITAPANNATFTSPATISITATASDIDGTVSKVEFYNGPTLLGTSTTSPYTYNWTNVASGTYTLTAKATDDKGGVSTSTPITVIVNNPNIAPTVSITAPANNATYVAPADITFTATANDADGTISKVEFYNGTTLLGTSNASPYTYTWTGVGAGTYSITAKAYDNLGLTGTSTAITVKVNGNQNPIVSIIGPANNATFISPATIAITATASDVDGTVAKVEFYNGTTLLGSSTTSPYSYNWTNVTAGTYTLIAKATDDKGGMGSSTAITVIVNNPNQPPTVSITAPADNSTFVAPSDITFTATANDADGTVSKVEFYNGTTLLGASSSAPYSYTWTGVGAGTYSITAKAYDNLGLTATSTAITVKVNGNQNPIVSITAPANNATFISPATIGITAIASDLDGTVSKIEIYNGTTLLGSSTSSPYTYSWTNVATGTYTLTAKATDDKGGVTTSSAITVIVNNPNQAPIVSITAPANNANFTSPANIAITAIANDIDGTVAKVEFYNGTTLLGSSTTSPYAYNWTNVVAGTYTITAKATDDKGESTTSAAITVLVNQPPTVSITAPANNATYVAPSDITFTATANDVDGTIAKVEFYNGASLLGTSNSAPYTYTWTNVTAGTYTITAKAYDNLGISTTSTAITVKVNANQNPTLSVNATSTTPNTVNITATANDADGTIIKVDFYDGATKIGTATSSPYVFTLTGATAGTHNITAVATDDKGGITTSTIVSVIVNDPNKAPLVSIDAPTNNSTYEYGATAIIKASATDLDGSVTKVEFYNGSTLLGSSSIAPYAYSWTNLTEGTYTITAKAYDNLNLVTTSTAITITVNPKPDPSITVVASSSSSNNVDIKAIVVGDLSIAKVIYYDGTVKIGEATASPFTFDWVNAPAGTHTITAVALDANKNVILTSQPVTVTVGGTPVPTISITSPVNNGTVNSASTVTFTVNVNAQDASVSKVEYYNGTQKIGESTTAPYSFNWYYLTEGTYTIKAVVTNSKGMTAQDQITVAIQRPTGIFSNRINSAINIYPNPTIDIINISEEVDAVSIRDLTGKELDHIVMDGKKVVDLSAYPSGVYMIQLIVDNQSDIIKITKD